MAASQGFHRNVSLLTQAISPSKDFEKHFKEGMFDRSNSMGFIHVSHYLLTIYDEERFKKLIDWPILDKRAEEKYRNGARDFITTIFKENELPFETPKIQKSHLVTPQGRIIINIMHALSMIVLRTYLRKAGVNVLEAPKQDAHPLTKLVFKTTIAQHEKTIKELDETHTKIENDAKEHANNRADSIEQNRAEITELSEKLSENIETADIHPDMKKRILDCNDTEVIELWMSHIDTGMKYLKQRQLHLKKIELQSTKLNNLVLSIFSDEKTILDGSKLPKIDTAKLMELPLDPEAQVALHHLYIDEKLVLTNMFIVCVSIMRYYHSYLKQTGFPDVTECIEQIKAGKEDLELMCTLIESMKGNMEQILSDLRSKYPKQQQHSINPEILGTDNDSILESLLLKDSPKTTINTLDYDPSRYDIQEKLKLTPVDDKYKALFARHRNPNDNKSNGSYRLKIPPSRINFDDTILSTNSDKLGTTPKRYTPTNPLKLNATSIESRVHGKFAGLFSIGPRNRSNSSLALTNFGKQLSSTVIEEHNSGNIYNISELRTQLANTSSVSVNTDMAISTESQNNTVCKNSLAIKDTEKSDFTTTIIGQDLGTISETTEANFREYEKTRQLNENKKQLNRRNSISELIERYKKIRDPSIPYENNGN